MKFRVFLGLWVCWCSLAMAADSVSCLKDKYVRPNAVPFPAANTFTDQRELLGRTLFFDPRLSSSGTVSCATCHNPAFGWDDGLPHRAASTRRTPSIMNLAWGDRFFWDGRAASLEEQALGPIQNPNEMDMPLMRMVKTIQEIAGYQPLFAEAYPGEPISETTVAKAIATFERTLVSADAPFDRWIAGNEDAISESAKRGFALFNRKAACASCHSGWQFTDQGFHDIGTVDLDPGRGKYIESEKMQHAFKTPGLRNAARRSAFMHDGSASTLQSVIDYYNDGGMCLRPSLDKEIHPLNLTPAEKHDLLQFLLTLSSNDRKAEIPTLPSHNLY